MHYKIGVTYVFNQVVFADWYQHILNHYGACRYLLNEIFLQWNSLEYITIILYNMLNAFFVTQSERNKYENSPLEFN